MATEEKKENKSGFANITEPQLELIQQLYEETNYERRYSSSALEHLTKNEAMKHIDYLKAYKSRMLQDQHNQHRVNGFDKITHAMIYKLVWKDWKNLSGYAAVNGLSFEQIVAEEYTKFKHCENIVKQRIAEGGQE